MPFSSAALRNMIDCQLLTNEVTDESVLSAIQAVSRENFVPTAFNGAAYADNQIPLGHNRLMLCPLTQGVLLQAAQIKPNHKVLHLASGLGYLTAVLAHMAQSVVAIESQHELLEDARNNLQNQHVKADIFNACLTVGYPVAAPYDVILIEGAVECVPPGLTDQLVEGGRLIAVKNLQQRIDAKSGVGRVMVVTKHHGQLQETLYQDVVAPLLPGFEKKKDFSF